MTEEQPTKKRRTVQDASDSEEEIGETQQAPISDDEDGEDREGDVDDEDDGVGVNTQAEEGYEELVAARGVEAPPSDESDGEDLEANAEADYAPIEYLDKYEEDLLDGRTYERMDHADRARAEAEMNQRDRGTRVHDLLADYGSEDEGLRDARRGRFDRQREAAPAAAAAAAAAAAEEEEEEDPVNLETFDVPLREWLADRRTLRDVRRRFRNFLTRFRPAGWAPAAGGAVGAGDSFYQERVRRMCALNLGSLEVSFVQLSAAEPVLTMWCADAPRDVLAIFDGVLEQVVLSLFPAYGAIRDELHVRITEMPVRDSLRDLREQHLNALVKVSGVVTRRTGVFPQLRLVCFTCGQCGYMLGPFQQNGAREVRPGSCPNCQGMGPFRLNQEKTVYRNYQKVTLQESPGTVPPGRVPRYKDVILLADLIDRARPGQEVEVTGVYMYAHQAGAGNVPYTGFPVFGTVIEANFVQQREDLMAQYSLTDQEKREILQLAKDPKIAQKIIRSIAPSIYGHTHMKTAVALSLFGGMQKNVGSKHRVRGDVNVLLLGDPGTAKSQVLKYVEKTAPRAVYTTGKGASAVGLTAAITKDPMTKEWVLEGGALVIADKGVCLIDEFDKMNEVDRTSLHEAMEQQSISISKAGVVTTLQARCAVIAAANPIGGRYDASLTLAENVELTDPILQRFDVLCVQQDRVDPVADERLARFVVGSHRRSHPDARAEAEARGEGEGLLPAGGAAEEEEDTIPQALLKKYLMYARHHVRPQLHFLDQEKLAQLYADLRKASVNSGGVPIAVRHIESIMRTAEAHARMCLRDAVREDDVNAAIGVMLESFIQSQKYSVRRALQRGFRKYLVREGDYDEALLHALQGLVRDARDYQHMRDNYDLESLEVHCEDLAAKARELGIYNVESFYQSRPFRAHNFTVDRERGVIIKNFY